MESKDKFSGVLVDRSLLKCQGCTMYKSNGVRSGEKVQQGDWCAK